MKHLLFAGAWLVTLAVAFLVGRSTAPEEFTTPEPVPVRFEGPPAPEVPMARGERLPASHSGTIPDDRPPVSNTARETVEHPQDLAAPTFDFRRDGAIAEISAAFRQYVEAQLARGPDGYMRIVRSIDRLVTTDQETLRHLNERTAFNEAYPWIRMLVQSEPRVLDLMEFIYRSMVESPGLFEGLDDDTLEIFTQGTPEILTGAMDEELLARMRDYATRILATPAEKQPEAIQGVRRDLERLLSRMWSEQLSQEEALELARSGSLNPVQALEVLKALDPRTIKAGDLNALLSLTLSSGNFRAVRQMQGFPSELLDATVLDEAVIRGMETEGVRGYYIQEYLAATGRQEWPDARHFFDYALSCSQKVRDAAVESLVYLRKRPDKAYIEDLLMRYDLGEKTKARLKARYQID